MASRAERILGFLSKPRTNAEIGDLLCDHGGAVARDMAKLRHRGLVVNLNPGKGRFALYAKATGEAGQ